MSDFERALNFTLKWEGGDTITNDPQDPGGLTKFGISQRSYPNEDIRKLTRGRAAFLYRRDYWDKAKCDDLPAPLNRVHFDCAVNSGINRANKILQQAAGVDDDGAIGKVTMTAIDTMDAINLANDAILMRERFYGSLARQNQDLSKFLGGWLNRCAALKKELNP